MDLPPVPPTVVVGLVSGLVTGLIALLGVLYSQQRSDKREDDRWDRERAAEREAWAREDALRTYDNRREAYVALVAAWNAYYWRSERKRDQGGPFWEDFEAVYNALSAVQIYGRQPVIQKAINAVGALLTWGTDDGGGPIDGSWLADLREAMRTDLGIT